MAADDLYKYHMTKFRFLVYLILKDKLFNSNMCGKLHSFYNKQKRDINLL